jgi:hypothetical protein
MGTEDGSKICVTCYGTGEIGSESGPAPCPDCGGAGYLPSASILVEWRSRDIERAYETQASGARDDIRWLAAELRRARAALLSIYALSDEGDDSELKQAIRFEANRVLGIYPIVSPTRKGE